MTYCRRKMGGFVAAGCAFVLLTGHACAVQDAVIAIVNNEVITHKDLRDYMSVVYVQLKADGQHSDAEMREIMEKVEAEGIRLLIDDRIVLNAANVKGIEAQRSAVDEKIHEIRSRYPSEKAFLAGLAAEGMTLTSLRQRIADQLKAQFFVEVEIKSDIQVHPGEITEYYHANAERFIRPESANFSSIFFPYGNDRALSQEQANTAYGQLKMGQDFRDVAARYSKTPSVDIITRGQMKPDIENEIFNLKPGEFTWPIDIGQGFFLFRLEQRVPTETVPLEEVKDQIKQHLFSQKFMQKMGAWLEQERKRTYIEVKDF